MSGSGERGSGDRRGRLATVGGTACARRISDRRSRGRWRSTMRGTR
ncbi:hypothetical protein ACFPM0_05555 [Pseudonocardia sulfidoxydans]